MSGRLLVERDHHGAGVAVEALVGVVVTDLAHGLAGELLDVEVGGGADLAADDDQAGRDEGLAGDAAERVLREDRVEHGVGNLRRRSCRGGLPRRTRR